MAHLTSRNGIFNVRFRVEGRYFQKSLKTREQDDAQAALYGIKQTLHLLKIGKLSIPKGIDAGEFVVSGGTATEPCRPKGSIPTYKDAAEAYLSAQEGILADSYISSQRTHLSHLESFLNGKSAQRVDKLSSDQLEDFIDSRRKSVDGTTVSRERITLRNFGSWLAAKKYVLESPAEGIPPIPSSGDMPPFRTKAQIEEAIRLGKITDLDRQRELWECLFLSPDEIKGLLKLVQKKAARVESFKLHAIPAYTGMRRGEVLRLRWSDIDLNADCLIAYSRKQSRRQKMTARQIDLHPELRSLLKQWSKSSSGEYVVSGMSAVQELDCDRANRWFWQPLRRSSWCLDTARNWFTIGFHTYRHSFASNMAAAGVDARVIDAYMGHRTEAMRKRYLHLFPSDRKAAISSFSLK